VRIKSHFKKTGKAKSLEEIASALAYITWQIAKNGAQNMQTSGWEVHSAEQRFAVITEFLAFLIQVADRLAYTRMPDEDRQRLMTEVARWLVDTQEDTQTDLLGPGDYRTPLIAKLNTRLQDYSEFDFTEEGPSYSFLRYFGSRVAEVMGERDRPWANAQVIDIEAPEAIKTLTKAMKDLFESASASGSVSGSALGEPQSAPLPEFREARGRIGED
jgi:hypothetical protein